MQCPKTCKEIHHRIFPVKSGKGIQCPSPTIKQILNSSLGILERNTQFKEFSAKDLMVKLLWQLTGLLMFLYTDLSIGVLDLNTSSSLRPIHSIIFRTNDEKVAVKRMTNIFDDQTDAKRAYREMHILR